MATVALTCDLSCTSGTFHQGADFFPDNSRGKQCACNALIGISVLPYLVQHSCVSPTDLDNVLYEGNNMYLQLTAKADASGYLSFYDLPTNVVVQQSTYTIHFMGQATIGILDDDAAVAQNFPTLRENLINSFQVSHRLLVMLGSNALCVFSQLPSHFYVFDSHTM